LARLSADRLTAARLLIRVEEGAFSSRLLFADVAPAARVRVLEVLRWMRALDTVLQRRCRRRLRKLDPEVRSVLRIGLIETMRLDFPAALATDGAVRLVRRLGRSSASSMVNAVLRKATADWVEILHRSSIDIRLSHPEWLYHRWAEFFGERATEAAMASAQERAITWAWFLDDWALVHLRDMGVALEAHPWCPGAWKAPNNASRLLEVVASGSAYAQDPSSQLVAHVAASLAGEGGRLLDLCAAPGGKTALMLRLREWSHVVAADLRVNRTRLMQPVVARAGGSGIVAADALNPPFGLAEWDLVLLDAPCTGTGTLRRHPELKWRLTADAIANLAEKQKALLVSALELVAPGGALLYTTCSIEPEENEDVGANLPRGFVAENLAVHLPPGVPSIATPEGGVRILPNPDGDGFTMHAIRRRIAGR
jgi:16S rRNA (cytosine967-C5)-methyltransferase